MRDQEETELIRRCRQGDSEAWRTLLHLHHDALFSAAYRITLNADEAEDALQDAWVRIAKGLSRFHQRSAFRTWAMRIVIHQALTRVTSRRPVVSLEENEFLAEPRTTKPSPEEEIDLKAALSALSVEERTAVVLHYAEGYAFREVAQILGVPLRTAADYAYRGLRHLRRHMTPEISLPKEAE